MRSIGTWCLVAAAILVLLGEIAPRHSLLAALEGPAESIPLGLSLPVALAILGAVLVLPTLIRFQRAPARTLATSPPPRARPQAESPSSEIEASEDWKEVLLEAVEAMDFEPGVSLLIDGSQGTPFTLVLERCTPGRARRTMDQLGLFLTRIPRPPRLTILFQDCERGNVPWQHIVSGGLAPHIGRQTARVVAQSDRVDLIFTGADPCYSQTTEEA